MCRHLRFRVTSLLWAILSCGLILGWWKDRDDLNHHNSDLKQRLLDAEALLEMRRLARDAGERASRAWDFGTVPLGQFRDFELGMAAEAFSIEEKIQHSPWRRVMLGLSPEVLVGWLMHSDSVVRLAAISELLKHGAPAVPELVAALNDRSRDVTWVALSGLLSCREEARTALPQVLAVMKRERSPVGVYAAYVAREIDAQAKVELWLLKLLISADAETSEWAVMLLERIRSPDSVPELLNLVGDSAGSGSTAVIAALGRLAQPQEATPILIRAYREAKDDNTRQAAALALDRIETRAARQSGTASDP